MTTQDKATIQAMAKEINSLRDEVYGGRIIRRQQIIERLLSSNPNFHVSEIIDMADKLCAFIENLDSGKISAKLIKRRGRPAKAETTKKKRKYTKRSARWKK